MRFSKFWAVLAPAVLLLALPASSSATQFTIISLANDSYGFAGISANGDVSFSHSGIFYTNFTNGVQTADTYTPPSFTADNGTPCSPAVPAGTQLIQGVCNNGLQAFTANPLSNLHSSLYWGFSQQLIFGAGSHEYLGPIYMNSVGDIVFENQSNEMWYEAINITPAATPEPASVLLFATGLIGPLFFLRRRTSSNLL